MQKSVAVSVDTPNTSARTRDMSLDNIRFFLILTVVFAHFLEICEPFWGSDAIYKFIYTFHMPAFIFLFGYNIKSSLNRILYRWFIPYMAFQCLYIAFSRVVLGGNEEFQFTTPYWLLWYILACIFYQLLIPLYDTTDKRRQLVGILCVWIISLLVGFEGTVGYYLSLSRFFSFQPWFLLGYYCKKNDVFAYLSTQTKLRPIAAITSSAVILLSVPFVCFSNVTSELLYGSYSYSSCNAVIWMRAAASVIALSWVVFLFVVIKPYIGRKYLCITTIGQNTWAVFLLHGFLVKFISVYCPQILSAVWMVVLVSCAILFLFGNRIAAKAVSLLSFSWLERFLGKYTG